MNEPSTTAQILDWATKINKIKAVSILKFSTYCGINSATDNRTF